MSERRRGKLFDVYHTFHDTRNAQTRVANGATFLRRQKSLILDLVWHEDLHVDTLNRDRDAARTSLTQLTISARAGRVCVNKPRVGSARMTGLSTDVLTILTVSLLAWRAGRRSGPRLPLSRLSTLTRPRKRFFVLCPYMLLALIHSRLIMPSRQYQYKEALTDELSAAA